MKNQQSTVWCVLKLIFLYSLSLTTGCEEDRVSIARLPGGLKLVKVEGAFGTIERHGKTIYPLDAKVEQGGPFSWECNEAFAVGDYIVGRCIKPPADSNTVQTKYFVIDARDPALLSSEDPADYLHEFTELHDLERSCHQLQIELPDSLKEK